MGAFSILNNITGLNAQNALNQNSVQLSRTLLRLSSGRRINSGADDAAGLQIADSLRANTRALDQAVRNCNDGIGVAQIADGAMQEISTLLTRAVTLAEQAATETTDASGRTSIQAEYMGIQGEISRIATQTNFNGVQLFTASGLNGSLSIFVGDLSSASSISVTIDSITTSGATVTDLGGENLSTIDLSTQTGAVSALTNIKDALAAVSSGRADIGVGINRLQAAESIIRDANVAEEVANMTKYQILAQSGMAALAQANSQSQSVLSLLRQ